jgi:molecular chaperone GrpE
MIEEIENIEEIEAKEPETEEEGDKTNDILKQKQKEIKNLEEAIKKKEEEYNILYDKYLRVNAEYDNFRKRTAKEKEGIYSDASIDVLKNILPVLDNIERAVSFCDVSEPEKVFEGFKIIYSQFINVLNKIGVEEIKSEGEQFNPEIHNAVMHEQNNDHPDNTITEVMQKGYIKGEKIIRPAMVKVVN